MGDEVVLGIDTAMLYEWTDYTLGVGEQCKGGVEGLLRGNAANSASARPKAAVSNGGASFGGLWGAVLPCCKDRQT